MRTIKGYLDEWRIQEYLLITFFISWLSWGILILLTGFNVIKFQSVIGVILFLIGGFGPTISAIMCIDGKFSFRKLWKFITDHKKKTIGYLLFFVALMVGSVVLSYTQADKRSWCHLFDTTTPQSVCFGQVFLSAIVAFIIITLIGGGNEELGWRGTLQPLMEKVLGKKIKNRALSFIVATLCVGLIWALWHLPLWFVAGSTQQGINYGLFVLSCIMLSFWLACIYRKTGSVLYCMIIHGLVNTLTMFIYEYNWIILTGFAVITLLSLVLAVYHEPKPSSEAVR